MKKLIFLFSLLGLFAFTTNVNAQSCGKSKTASSCSKGAKKGACCSKGAKKGACSSKTAKLSKAGNSVASVAAANNPAIEEKVCATTGKVSYYKTSVCKTTGKISKKPVRFDEETSTFVDFTAAEKKAFGSKSVKKAKSPAKL